MSEIETLKCKLIELAALERDALRVEVEQQLREVNCTQPGSGGWHSEAYLNGDGPCKWCDKGKA